MLQQCRLKLIRSSSKRNDYSGYYLGKRVNVATGRSLDAAIWAGISHKNITPILLTFDEQALNCVIFRALDRSIHDEVRLYGKFSEMVCWKSAIQLLDVLKYLHDMDILVNSLTLKTVYISKSTGNIMIADLLDATMGTYSNGTANCNFNTRLKEISGIGLIVFQMITGTVLKSIPKSKTLSNMKCSDDFKNLVKTLLYYPRKFQDNQSVHLNKENLYKSQEIKTIKQVRNEVIEVEQPQEHESLEIKFSYLNHSLASSIADYPDRLKVEAIKEYLYSVYPDFLSKYDSIVVEKAENKQEFMSAHSGFSDGSEYGWMLLEILYYESMLY